MSERTLASIQKITSLKPIKDADRIETATVLGWEVVVQKGLHQVGDLVVYFEIDSVLPEVPEFEFLRKSCYVSESTSVNGAGFRLKTIRLKKQLSQGMIMPIRELTGYLLSDSVGDPTDTRAESEFYLEEGNDVTDILGVKKFERPIPANLAGKVRGNFPSFIPKTDQQRIQNFIGKFCRDYWDHEWEVSLKLDGSSMTAYYYAPEDRFGVCSRNMDLTETEENSYWQAARKYGLEEKMRDAAGAKSFAIQGELMGPGIQGNPEKFDELRFFVYDIYDIDNKNYLPSDLRVSLCNYLDLEHVPVFETSTMGYDNAKGFLELAEYGYDGVSINAKIREGLVFKSFKDPSVSFKAISNRFLMNGGD